MKKLVLILLLLPAMSFGQVKKKATQSKKAVATENVKRWFKTNYVDVYFKDPYSYKLLKIELEPYTKEMELKASIRELQMATGNAAIGNTEIIGVYNEMLSKGSKAYLSAVSQYRVALDAYGKNGYGNNVLGKYRFFVDLKGGSPTKVMNLNEED